jgi:hypothetical protein
MPQQSVNGNLTPMANTSDQCQQEGAQIIQLSAMVFDGTGSITYNYNTDNAAFRKPSSIRSLYFDARPLASDALLSIASGPTYRIPFGKQGYIPLFMPTPMSLSLTSAAGNGAVTLYLFNFKVQPLIW